MGTAVAVTEHTMARRPFLISFVRLASDDRPRGSKGKMLSTPNCSSQPVTQQPAHTKQVPSTSCLCEHNLQQACQLARRPECACMAS